jgi:hypothetical protein
MLALAPDDCLSARAGRLFLEDIAAAELARRFRTPLFVISEARLRGNARRWRAAVAAAWPHGPALVLPSLKANTVLALRRILDEEGLGCDVFGLGELELALRAGVPPDRISLNGATKPTTRWPARSARACASRSTRSTSWSARARWPASSARSRASGCGCGRGCPARAPARTSLRANRRTSRCRTTARAWSTPRWRRRWSSSPRARRRSSWSA